MESRTAEWPVPPLAPGSEAREADGLRERKKRLMRQQLSDTATRMFMERGFDGVRVSEIAEACGVSEKTVFNYFPTKESLILDRLEATMASLKSGLADPGAVTFCPSQVTRPSRLVKLPRRSVYIAAGSTTSARAALAVRKASMATTKPAPSRACAAS